MSESLLIGLALIVTIVGMGLCALTIEPHWRQIFGARPTGATSRWAMRIGGVSAFGLAFWVCTKANPVTMAVLVWTMLLTVSAAAIAAGLSLMAARRSSGRPPKRS